MALQILPAVSRQFSVRLGIVPVFVSLSISVYAGDREPARLLSAPFIHMIPGVLNIYPVVSRWSSIGVKVILHAVNHLPASCPQASVRVCIIPADRRNAGRRIDGRDRKPALFCPGSRLIHVVALSVQIKESISGWISSWVEIIMFPLYFRPSIGENGSVRSCIVPGHRHLCQRICRYALYRKPGIFIPGSVFLDIIFFSFCTLPPSGCEGGERGQQKHTGSQRDQSSFPCFCFQSGQTLR